MAWTTGEQQAERYDLSSQVEYLAYSKRPDGNIQVLAGPKNQEGEINLGTMSPDKLADTVGKEMAQKIIDSKEPKGIFKGLDLKVGGEGMKGFYDSILPAYANKYAKKWGAKTGETDIGNGKNTVNPWAVVRGGEVVDAFANQTSAMHYASERGGNVEYRGNAVPVHSIDVTPSMRASVMEGQPDWSIRQDRSPSPQRHSLHQQSRYPSLRLHLGESLDRRRHAGTPSHPACAWRSTGGAGAPSLLSALSGKVRRALGASAEGQPAGLEALADALEQARAHGKGADVPVVNTERPLSYVKGTLRHEWWHQFQHLLDEHLGDHEQEFLDHPVAQQRRRHDSEFKAR